MIEGHGNDVYRYGMRVRSDFSSNVAGQDVPLPLLSFITSRLHTLATYPEPDSKTMRELLAQKYDLFPEQIFVTNGSVEAFYLIALAFRESRSLVYVPSFSEYEDACRMHNHSLRFEAIEAFEATDPVYDLVWLGNPNNPDGRLLSVSAIRKQLQACSNTIFVVDEAYGDLCQGFESVVGLIGAYENLIVVRSMTKQFVLPGLRLGYLLTSRTLSKRLRSFCTPWSVNALAQQVGCYLVENADTLLPDKTQLLDRSFDLQARLSLLPDLIVLPSVCSFFLVRLLKRDASFVKEYVLSRHGLLVRDASNFRGLNNRFVRISTQTVLENEQLYVALKNALQESNISSV
jgi:threonine-phosphate decarboxylase